MSKIWTFPPTIFGTSEERLFHCNSEVTHTESSRDTKKCQTDQNIHFMFFKGALMTDLHTIGIQPASWDTIATHFK